MIAALSLVARLTRQLASWCQRLAPSSTHRLPLAWAFGMTLSLGLLAGGLLLGPGPAQAAGSDGAALFQAHCAGCHVHGGNIIRRGRTLKLQALERNGITSAAAIATIAAEGIGQMGGYGQVLGPVGPEQVGEYVWQQALVGWPAQ